MDRPGQEAVETGVPTGDEEQRRLLLVCQQVVELATAAVDIVFRTAGTSATRKGEAVERCFRDVNMIRTHVTMQFDRTFENVGQMRLGLPPAGFLLGAAALSSAALRLGTRRGGASRTPVGGEPPPVGR
jgi:hypothetical protein